MVKKKDLKYLNKTYQELFKIKRVLDSCITPEQFDNTVRWFNQIIDNWDFRDKNLSHSAKKIIFNIVINDLDKSYNENLERIKNDIATETKKQRAENVIVKGFC